MSSEIEKARALIVEENKKRTTACWAEVQKVLEKHGCQLSGSPEFIPGPTGYVVRVNIWVSAQES